MLVIYLGGIWGIKLCLHLIGPVEYLLSASNVFHVDTGRNIKPCGANLSGCPLTLCFPYISTITAAEWLKESLKTCETHLYSVKSFGKALVELERLEIEGTVTLTDRFLTHLSLTGFHEQLRSVYLSSPPPFLMPSLICN